MSFNFQQFVAVFCVLTVSRYQFFRPVHQRYNVRLDRTPQEGVFSGATSPDAKKWSAIPSSDAATTKVPNDSAQTDPRIPVYVYGSKAPPSTPWTAQAWSASTAPSPWTAPPSGINYEQDKNDLLGSLLRGLLHSKRFRPTASAKEARLFLLAEHFSRPIHELGGPLARPLSQQELESAYCNSSDTNFLRHGEELLQSKILTEENVARHLIVLML